MKQTDLDILRILEADGRIAFSALADKVGLSKTPCWSRVKALEESGVIEGYEARISPQAAGLNVCAFIHVTIDLGAHQAFEAAVDRLAAVRACSAITGDADYLLEVYATDIAALDELLRSTLSKLPGVMRFSTTISTRRVKSRAPVSAMINAAR